MERQARPQDVTWFLDLNRLKQLNLTPPYQRKSVWSKSDKEFFLDTIFNNYPCPSVFLHKSVSDTGSGIYHVVDGKQRLLTILEFARDDLEIPGTFNDVNIAGKKFSELDKDAKRKFWDYVITVEMLPSVDNSFVNDVFDRINRNARKLTRQELRHAKYDGWLSSLVESEVNQTIWKDLGIVTTARAKRMADVQFVSELVAVLLKRRILGFDQDFLDELYAEYDDLESLKIDFDEDAFTNAFGQIKDFIRTMNESHPDLSKYTKTLTHFYSLWTCVILTRPAGVDAPTLANRYVRFMAGVSELIAAPDPQQVAGASPEGRIYANNARGASTDFPQREQRNAALVVSLSQA
jgi:hypothetical protein